MAHSFSPTGSVRGLRQNRRRGRRHQLDIAGTLVAEADASSELTVKIVELSVHGVGIRSAEAFVRGEIYQVRAFDTLVPPGMRIKVISNRKLADGAFAVGGEVV